MALRDLVLLNTSFFGLLRRSEAQALRLSDVQTTPKHPYFLIHLRRSKTDQSGNGATIPVLLRTSGHDWSALWHTYHALLTHRAASALFPTTSPTGKVLF